MTTDNANLNDVPNARIVTDLDCLKGNVVREMFIDTADNTYAVARWCFLNRLYLDFYWNGVHAVEKYLKAALLLNGRSSISDVRGNRYGHEIPRLLAAANEIFPLGIHDTVPRPERYGGLHWHEETLANFVGRFYELGEPNNRYNMYGYSQRPEDLVKLDALVFRVRNIAQDLDGYAFLGSCRHNGGENLSMRNLLHRFPNQLYGFVTSRLRELSSPKKVPVIKNAVLDQNLFFAPSDYQHPPVNVGWSTANSVLYMRIFVYLESESYKGRRDDRDLVDWILQNVYVPKELERELVRAKEAIEARLSTNEDEIRLRSI